MRTLYKDGGQVEIWGQWLDYVVVEEADVEKHLADGWRLHPIAAEGKQKKAQKSKGDRDGKDEG